MLQLLLAALTFSVLASPDVKELSQSKKWHNLLHYKKTLFGGYKSQADGKEFFLHPEGKNNPQAELEELIKQISEKKRPKDGDAACKFPLRSKWVNKELGFPFKIDYSGCKTYFEFFQKVAARRASIVFSSYYLGNPNSAFGHTLLRLSRYQDSKETEMLDYGINFAAEARENNPVLYAFKGLMGGFEGRFAAIPYYYKIREYSNYEFRDLWSYELDLTFAEVLEAVDHIWELGQTHFDYYYFHENCSYHLLSILEVVRPELDLTSNYNVYTIPADTIRILDKHNLLLNSKRRESTYSMLQRLSEGLSHKELVVAKKIAQDPIRHLHKLKFGSKKNAEILDVSIEAFDYFNAEKILVDDKKTKEKKEPLLIARARNKEISDIKEAPLFLRDSPAKSHSPTRHQVFGGHQNKLGGFLGYEWRAALHDLLDPPAGSLKSAQLEMFKGSFLYQDLNGKNKIVFDQFSLLSLRNYPAQNFWATPISWEIEVGAQNRFRRNCFDCPELVVNGSVGSSIELNNEKVLMSFLLNAEGNAQNYYQDGYRLGIGPKVVMRYLFDEKWGVRLSSYYHFNTYRFSEVGRDGLTFSEVEARYHLNSSVSLGGKYQHQMLEKETVNRFQFSVMVYY
ncbi:MAG: DUF4105 domain-containing protein [Candidatus Caldatribacteriota bacterium]